MASIIHVCHNSNFEVANFFITLNIVSQFSCIKLLNIQTSE